MTVVPNPETRAKILCIIDDPQIIVALESQLRTYDVEILGAYFGTQGIWFAVTEHPNAIITDISMPNGQGEHVVECLRRRDDTSKIPVIVLTRQCDQRIKQKMTNLGIDRYLQKPTTMNAVVHALEQLIDLQPTRQKASNSLASVGQIIRENNRLLQSKIQARGIVLPPPT